eukprot:scaffold120_cov59-Cylindrotheca_fusiformis.AAC.12
MKTPIHLMQREIEALDGLHHPNLIQLQAVYEEPRFIHIVTELCTGGELHDRVVSKDWTISESEAAELIHNIVRGIAYCHKHGIVHRDLKASNFMFVSPTTKTNVKIIDFGLARKFSKEKMNSDGNVDETEWVMRSQVGTPYYVAPEVLTQETYNAKCDVWSIGVVAYVILSGGTLPFHGEDEAATLRLLEDPNLNVKFEPSEPWNAFDESAKDFCRALLQKDPKKRPTSEEALELTWLCENYNKGGQPPLESDDRHLRQQSSSVDKVRDVFQYIFCKAKSAD